MAKLSPSTKIHPPTIITNPIPITYIPRIPKNLTIIRDTREQLPYSFAGKIPYVDKGLKSGDYSIVGFEDKFVVERKSMADLYSTLGSQDGRRRFNNMLDRIKGYDFKALVIEGSEEEVLTPQLSYSNIHPNSVYGSLVSFEIKHNIHVYCASRKAIQIRIINWAVKYWQENTEKSKSGAKSAKKRKKTVKK